MKISFDSENEKAPRVRGALLLDIISTLVKTYLEVSSRDFSLDLEKECTHSLKHREFLL